MRIRTREDVVTTLDGAIGSAALGAAMELGLFWLLGSGPLSVDALAAELDIPATRCLAWLRVLERDGLLARDGATGQFGMTDAARGAVVETYTPATWALLAQEARERREALYDLPARLLDREPRPGGPDYVSRMAGDPARARRFCRMLWELHEGLAAHIAAALDLGSVEHLLDLGGGSGVVAVALARRHPGLRITIVDIANVCAAGREIVDETGFGGRIDFVAADLLCDPLPGGFEVALECDVGLYREDLFARVRTALTAGGRLFVVDQLPPDAGSPPVHLAWALEGALRDDSHEAPTVAGVVRMLEAAGFEARGGRPLPVATGTPAPGRSGRVEGRGHDTFAERFVVIEARARPGRPA